MLDLKESEKIINSFSFKVGRRLQAAGAPMHLIEDVRQELWIAWCKARDTYDESSPASFKTYLYGGMRIHMNNWIRDNINRRHAEVIAKSMDAELDEENGGATLADMIPSADPTPEVTFWLERTWEFAVARLSPRSRQFVELLREPPEGLLAQVRQIEARTAFAKAQGISAPFNNRVTTSMVFDLMGASRNERIKIAAEIRKLGAKMEKAA
jgi:DNA-directed RNA polymerase specialized sigma24 family protein